MNLKTFSMFGTLSAIFAGGGLLLGPVPSLQAAEEEMQILTRGPVHEAFAESVSFEAEAGIIISSRVPEPIEEMPPDQQPEGDNVTWIPGYWTWDDDQNDFIWISGIWRNLPPGRQWVPGYWSEIDGGRFQWTSGYWADSTVKEVEYVSTAPPRSIDSGPNIAAPSIHHSWIPGNWYWVDTRYVWRPGYWVPLRANWTWVPARYCWTRLGYVYVDGYWDYAVARRGVLFAPVYFRQRVYVRPDYYYTPSIVVSLNVFSSHLFVHPRCRHYYFGDYYAPRYREAGYYASFSWHSGRRGYDPIYAYDRWEHRGDARWERRRREDFNYFRDHEDARPPRTWAAMREYRQDRFSDGRNRIYATSLEGYAKDNKSGQRFRALDESRRREIVSQRQEMRKFGQERRQLESRGKAVGDDSRKTVAREAFNRSPVRGRDAEKLSGAEAPPKRPEARGEKGRVIPATKNQPGAKGKTRDSVKPPVEDKSRKIDRGGPSRDSDARGGGKVAPPRSNRDGEAEKVDRVVPKKNTNDARQVPQKKTPQREKQAEPKRESPAKPQVRNGPPSERRVVPQRQGPPKSEVRKESGRLTAPKREAPAKPQVRQAPERRTEASPRRESRPQPKARPVPQNKEPAPRKELQSKDVETTREKSKKAQP